MKWTDDMAVGVDIIDCQHKELISKINDLVAAVNEKTCKYKIGDVVQFLGDYILFHFGEEEQYMRKYNYPGYDGHRALHQEFIRSYDQLKKELSRLEGGRKPGSYDLSVETNRIVVDWIFDHIMKADMKLGDFLKDRV